MTIAQLVHPARGLAWHPRQPFIGALRHAVARCYPCNAALWRAIGTGLAFALVGLAMIVLAIGTAGVASPTQEMRGVTPLVAPTMPQHRVAIYQDPADDLNWAIPVP